jgi:hypothetical protein
VGAGQKSIFNFFAVAAPSARSGLPQNSNTDTTADHDFRSSCLPVHHANSAPQPTAAHISSGTPGPASSGVTTEQEPSQSQAVQSESRQGSPEAFLPQTPLAGPLLINTRVVGRQHQSAGWPPAVGSELLLTREAHNPVDQCAILVREGSRHWALGTPCSSCLAPVLSLAVSACGCTRNGKLLVALLGFCNHPALLWHTLARPKRLTGLCNPTQH